MAEHLQKIAGYFASEIGSSVANGFNGTAVGQGIAERPFSAEIMVFLQNVHGHREQRLVWVGCPNVALGCIAIPAELVAPS